MIPSFNEHGELPEGIWNCSLEDIEARFCRTRHRKKLFQGLLKLITDLKTIKCAALYVDGSFITDKFRPNDIDVLWESDWEPNYNYIETLMPILGDKEYEQKKEYDCHIFPARITEDRSGLLFKDFFQRVRKEGRKKGILKINL